MIGEIENTERVPASQVARIFEMSRQCVHSWAWRGCPQNQDKTFNLPAVIAWRQRDLSRRRRKGAPDSPELQRLRKARADLAEMEVTRIRADLVSVSDVRRDVAETLAMFKGAFADFSTTLAPRIAGKSTAAEIGAILDEDIRGRLTELCKRYEVLANG